MTARRSLLAMLGGIPFARSAVVPMHRSLTGSSVHAGGLLPGGYMAELQPVLGEAISWSPEPHHQAMEKAIARQLARYLGEPVRPPLDGPAPWGWDDLENVR